MTDNKYVRFLGMGIRLWIAIACLLCACVGAVVALPFYLFGRRTGAIPAGRQDGCGREPADH